MVENAKIENSNETFWVIFKHCVRKCEQVIDQVENKERSHAFVLMHVTRIE